MGIFGSSKKDGFTSSDDVVMNAIGSSASSTINDDEELARMGYKSEFKREFTNLGTISFAFSIMCVLLFRCWTGSHFSSDVLAARSLTHVRLRLDPISQGSLLVRHIYLRHAYASRWPRFGCLVLDVSSDM